MWGLNPITFTPLAILFGCPPMPVTEEASGFCELVVGEACLVQKLLLPREPLRGPNYEVTYLVRTFDEVGGDFLDYFLLSDGMLGIYVCDVVGKGLPAALYAAPAAGTLRSIKKTGEEPSAVLELFNKRLLVRPVPVRYCASQYAVFDPRRLELRLGNAGLPLWLHLSENGCSPIGKGGLPSKQGVVVEVYLAANKDQFVGRAKVIHVEPPGASSQACDFQFIEKPTHWILP